MKPDLCIYHANCDDGFGAAYAVWKAYGDAVKFHPGIYQAEPPDVTGLNVAIVARRRLRRALKRGERLRSLPQDGGRNSRQQGRSR